MKHKKEMIRIVQNENGDISLDTTGRKNGRGAYVCPRMECLESAKKSKGLERSFKTTVPPLVYENLKQELGFSDANV